MVKDVRLDPPEADPPVDQGEDHDPPVDLGGDLSRPDHDRHLLSKKCDRRSIYCEFPGFCCAMCIKYFPFVLRIVTWYFMVHSKSEILLRI